VLGKHVTKTYALESLVFGSILRPLDPRRRGRARGNLRRADQLPLDGLADPHDTRVRYRALVLPPRSEHGVVYLFLDAVYLKLHPDDEPAEGVLVAWGVTLEGRKLLLGLALGSRESYEAWLAFGRDLVDRGMNAPALVVADGAPSLWKAVREFWPARPRRCRWSGPCSSYRAAVGAGSS
jgi:hypothetical protein